MVQDFFHINSILETQQLVLWNLGEQKNHSPQYPKLTLRVKIGPEKWWTGFAMNVPPDECHQKSMEQIHPFDPRKVDVEIGDG